MKLSQFERLIFLLSFGTLFIKYKEEFNELHQFKVVWLGVNKSLYCATLTRRCSKPLKSMLKHQFETHKDDCRQNR